jgi:ABC-2 type transport system ATP-binding protein
MSDRVAIMLQGSIVDIGTTLDITATGAGLTKISVRTNAASLADPDLALPAVDQRMTVGDYTVFFSTDIGSTVSAIIARIEAEGDTLIDLRVERPSLEDRFLEITQIGGAR